MPSEVRDAIRELFSARDVVLGVAVLALFRVVFDFSWLSIAVFAGTIATIQAVNVADAVPSVDERYVLLFLALILVASGGFAHWRGDTTSAVVLGVAGGWLLLDTLYKFRYGIGAEPASDGALDEIDEVGSGEAMLRMQLGSLVAQELKEGPKTVPELAESTDMTESRVRQALELHQDAGIVTPEGGQEEGAKGVDVRFVLDESKVGPVAFVRDNGTRLVKRLLRPFRLFVPS